MLQGTTADLSRAIKAADLGDIDAPGRFDSVIVGGGAAGGLAAELLTAAGLKVLVLDAGFKPPFWRTPLRRTISLGLSTLASPAIAQRLPASIIWKGEQAARRLGRLRQPIQSECYAWPSAPESFVDDKEQPYETPPDRPFNWVRVHALGGRMVVPMHGRQYYRHCERDFQPTDGLSPAWPFAPDELNAWYDMVEAKLGLSGRTERHPWAPDSQIALPREPTPAEAAVIARVLARWPTVKPILGRFAPPRSTLAVAAETGRLAIRQGAVVRHVETSSGRVSGVVFYDRREKALRRATAPIVFLCAGTLGSTRVLLSSQSEEHPDGLGGRSDSLGRHLMDHVSIKIEGVTPPLGAHPTGGVQGHCLYLPRFDARDGGDLKPTRGYGVRTYVAEPAGGSSYFVAVADSEMLPRPDNTVTLSSKTDAWGLPILRISCARSPGELARSKEQAAALAELAEVVDLKLKSPIGEPAAPGSAIHECGTARMGTDPAHSVLDPHNECWDAKGLYVTDGASFPSEGNQNPTLTILALTARACARATAH